MSTRAIIARPDPDHGWAGRYHHWGGYPKGLGRSLWQALNGHWRGDVAAMLKVLLDDHPAGWSCIVDVDWSLEPGWCANWQDGDNARRPECYCHGARQDPPRPWLYPHQDAGAEWVYVLDADARTMAVYEGRTGDGAHAVGAFGINPARDRWALCATFDLDGPEPDWVRLTQGGRG